jgi:translation initiation factor 1
MADEKPFHNPFAALGALKTSLPTGAEPPSPDVTPTVPTPPAGGRAAPQGRAVVRYERSGRGGKQVTVIEQLELADAERAEWLRSFKSALGCGGALDGTAIVLQGDQRSRLPALLTARHVKKVIVS